MVRTFIVVAVLFISQTFAQGTLFIKEEADQRFGPVFNSVEIQLSTFNYYMSNVTNHLMFKIVDNQAIILDGNRNVIYPDGLIINQEDVFTSYSITIIKDLIEMGKGVSILVEQRSDVLSITCGQMTMEVGSLCPPYCTD